MNIETIRVVINKEGQVQLEVEGVHGPVCLELTDEIIQALGGEQLFQDLKAEYFESNEEQALDQIKTSN